MQRKKDSQYGVDEKLYDLKFIRMEEDEVIDRLIEHIYSNPENTDLHEFRNALYGPFSDIPKYKGIYVAKRILRRDLKLHGERQPGDIDILIVPYDDTQIYFDRSAVFEVKVVRPSRQNPNRRPNRYGANQIMGYIEDGFSFVSALHVCITEPLLPHERTQMKFILRPANVEEPIPNDLPPMDAYQNISIDWFPRFSADKHMRRMIACGLPKYVGLSVVSWNLSSDNSLLTSRSFEFREFEGCTWNPHRKIQTAELIREHFHNNKGCYQDIPIVYKPYKTTTSIGDFTGFEYDGEHNVVNSFAKEDKIQTLQEIFPIKNYIRIEYDEKYKNAVCCPVKGNGMDDGTSKAIKEGDIILIKDIQLPTFDNFPMFVPICILWIKEDVRKLLLAIVTKKDRKSQFIRLSFYNIQMEETWIYYGFINQIFEYMNTIPKDIIVDP